ncbi:hypothetical protein JKP88DRAFT_285323 [Tribonema minus]|uniref:Uncharacterized protein n=1 Tax=Tribonema minus TaxID=303371 RepID=A0A836CN29_9STRA|nr:hypothetical protein JKP88DRAFT_285323 [Tribonema minus]
MVSDNCAGERVFNVYQHTTIFCGFYASTIVPYSPYDSEGALTQTLMWKERRLYLYRFKRLPIFRVNLVVTFADAFIKSIVCDRCGDLSAGDFVMSTNFNCPQQRGTCIMCVHGDAELHRSLQFARLEAEAHRMEQVLGADYDLLQDFVSLRNALKWHYSLILKMLYRQEFSPNVWPVLRAEHIAADRKDVRTILREWLSMRPGLSDEHVLARRTAEIYRNALAWEKKRQCAVGGAMQSLQGEKLPHLMVPGVLSNLHTVHTFFPCVKQTLMGSAVWNRAAFR